MAYYKTCPECGATLDPGEKCDCRKETAPGATNNRSGEVEQASRKLIYSTSILPNDMGGCQD